MELDLRYTIVTLTNGKEDVTTCSTFTACKSIMEILSDDLIEDREEHLKTQTSHKMYDNHAKPNPHLHHYIDVNYPKLSLPSRELK